MAVLNICKSDEHLFKNEIAIVRTTFLSTYGALKDG